MMGKISLNLLTYGYNHHYYKIKNLVNEEVIFYQLTKISPNQNRFLQSRRITITSVITQLTTDKK